MPNVLTQRAILQPPASLARFHVFGLRGDVDAGDAREALARLRDALPAGAASGYVVGVGEPLVRALGAELVGLGTFPALSGPGVGIPSTQGALLCACYGGDRGVLLHDSRALQALLEDAFELQELVDTFTYGEGRDLTGYMDGTENPQGDAAEAAALVTGRGAGFDGGSFVAVQRWVHDLDAFEDKSPREQDLTIGRARATDEEIAEAPASAHVKRAAQEDFEPDAFMLRRSMPYATDDEEGLLFVAYGESLGRYERVLRRMVGLDDGVTDALFSFSEPLTGGYYFCPPLAEGLLDLRVLGL